jgi:hypothetical protein
MYMEIRMREVGTEMGVGLLFALMVLARLEISFCPSHSHIIFFTPSLFSGFPLFSILRSPEIQYQNSMRSFQIRRRVKISLVTGASLSSPSRPPFRVCRGRGRGRRGRRGRRRI